MSDLWEPDEADVRKQHDIEQVSCFHAHEQYDSVTIGPFIPGKIRRVLHKTRLKKDKNCTIYTSMSYLIRRVLAKTKCAVYTESSRLILCKTRLIIPRINGPNMTVCS